jgi:hypothetical protein
VNRAEAKAIAIEKFKWYFDKLQTGFRKIQEGDKDWKQENVNLDAESCKEIAELLEREAVMEVVYPVYCNEQFSASGVQLKNLLDSTDSSSKSLVSILPELAMHFPVIIEACREKLRTELREVYGKQEAFPVVRNPINCYCVCKELSLEPPVMARAVEEVVISHLLHNLKHDISSTLMDVWKENPRPLVDKLIRMEQVDLKKFKLRVQKLVDQVAERTSADSVCFLSNLSTEAEVWDLVPTYTGAQLAQVTFPYFKDVHTEMMDNNGPYWGLVDAVEDNLPRVLSLANKLVPKSEHTNFILELAKLVYPTFSGPYATTWLAGLIKGLKPEHPELVYQFLFSQEDKESLASELGGPDDLVQKKKNREKAKEDRDAEERQKQQTRLEKVLQAEKERLNEALSELKRKDSQ